ncbi:MAG: type II toxin-antitoxin system RelE/ParE family toxin [Oscillospiraceae bacterium]|jgi:plasmid stabilization system protein ParE|nr:type II toxin-antitoxin system RelE/ParE family toxin [Oscillospiraceae bacterium]
MQDEICYDVSIAEAAWEQLIEHARFLANVSGSAADRLVDEFIEKTNSLAKMPERCPWISHDMLPFQKYRKLFFGKYHMALFEIREKNVYVTAVVDCRQDYIELLLN